MIRSIRHKGLTRLYEDDDSRGVIAEHVDKLRDILARLDSARAVTDIDVPGLRVHSLKGQMKGFWAVTVRANWRVISASPTTVRSTLTIWTTTKLRIRPCL
jgi:proteic killer suppression protein